VLRVLAVGNYRSLRHLVMPLGPLNVVTGANGSGKSSLYRALRLLADSSCNGAVAALAREGGLTSTLWAGPAQGTSEPGRWAGGPKQVALRLGFAGDEFGYAIDLGLPVSNQSMFGRDPEIKAESLWHGPVLRPSTVLVERNAGVVQVRSDEGPWAMVERRLRPYDSMLGELSDPRLTPEVLTVREEVRSWRFYDHFRTDATSPARCAQVGTRTQALQADGADLPAAIQTIVESGNGAALAGVVDRAFPGSRMEVQDTDGRFELTLSQPGLLRPLRTAELSDGTLRYLLLAAALLSARPPGLLVLNEPETSLHPDLLGPLAHLITTAVAATQVVVVTHSQPLIRHLQSEAADEVGDLRITRLVKRSGETLIDGQTSLTEPPWTWPKR
jgi:predicted ATPase